MDRIAAELGELGYRITPQNLREHDVEGNAVQVGDVQIVYRLDDDDDQTVFLCLIRRRGGFQGIRSSFAKLIWFVGFLAENRDRLNVRRVKGLVRAEKEGTDSPLSSRRIMAFYKRLFKVYHEGVGYTGKWVCLDLQDYEYPGRYSDKLNGHTTKSHESRAAAS